MTDNKLSWLEEVKADAAFNYHQRLREEKTRQDYEAGKNAPVAEVVEAPAPTPEVTKPEENKKGK